MEHFRFYPMPQFGDNSPAARTDELRDRLHSALRIVDQISAAPVSRRTDQPVTERDVRAMLKMRRNRDQFFADGLFADPAWDILLSLYAAELGQQSHSVGSLCEGAAAPATTALRWIKQLEDKGLIERRADQLDGRRYYVSLSRAGIEAMDNYFKTVPAGAAFI
jgi:DNA-binding MarR family transcriptional regulator